MPNSSPKLVFLGGGSGNFALLSAIKEYAVTGSAHICAVVNMSDSGGSSGELRDEHGILPPGDIRQCLVALSTFPDAREMFGYRFDRGKQSGDSLGNLIIAAFTHMKGDFREAIRSSGQLLQVAGQVLPVSYDDHQLVLQDGSNRTVAQHQIDLLPHIDSTAIVSLEPRASIDEDARAAIERADMVIISPGSVYTSLLPVFAVDGVKEALQATRGKIVAVSNLVTKAGHTDSWHVVDHIRMFERYIGEGAIDTVLYNNQEITPALLEAYAAEGDYPVDYHPDRLKEITAKPIGARLVSQDIVARIDGERRPKKTLIRHDGDEVGRQLMNLLHG